ncbi:MAG: malto-oligosyltrehalose trehalohydrolase [Acidobacteriaceae bacterium]|nr:malto-oligosyltrehalose trehalohydrolase [Acidobacteriaceae bacterium]
MHKFTVWAPKAMKMAVKIDDHVYPMSGPSDTGWWDAKVETAGAETDYAFLLNDDTTPYPDPRSPWQANGVHGPSRVVDHKAFQWNDAAWQGPPLGGAVIYELHIGTFTPEGTFDAAIGKLDYLFDLGITHIEIMPVAAFPGDFGWGYDGVALFAVRHTYGGPEALKRLVDACHQRGIGVLIDVVYNHFGPVGNYANMFGPYMTSFHRTPWGDAINFEAAGSDEVRRFFCDNALMWMRDYHVDGLRLDAVHEFVDRSAIHFMEQLSAEVDVLSSTLGRRLILIAESDLNDPRVVTPREARGYGMDAQWSDDFHHALFTILHVEQGKGYYDDFGSFADLAKSLKRAFVYDGEFSRYRDRSHGRPVEGLSAHHFVCFIQNHDQVGNRATGDRLEHIIGLDRAKVAAGLVLSSPFIPMLFQGEEYAASTPFQYFADHEDGELRKAVSEGRKREFAAFGWKAEEIPDPESPETFNRSKLNWDEVSQGKHADMLEWCKQLIHFRRSSSTLNDGDMGHVEVSYDEEKRWLVVGRGLVTVLCNLGDEEMRLDAPEDATLALASRPDVRLDGGLVVLPSNTLAILTVEALNP